MNKRITHIRNINKVAVLGVIVSICLGLGIYMWIRVPRTLADIAQHIVTICKKSSLPSTCYDTEIPQRAVSLTMEEAFQLTKLVQQKDPSYAYCHVLGHKLSTLETKKDPSKWKEIITRCPSGVCSNGCVHGAFQERYRTDVLSDDQIDAIRPDLSDVCEPRGTWNPTSMEQATCYHALGHLFMYITGANSQKSSILCEQIAYKNSEHDYTRVCFDGVFMQIFQPLEPDDFALIRGKEVKKQDLTSFCSSFTGTKKASCLSEGWPLYFHELLKPDGLISFCAMQDPEGIERCYDSITYILVVQLKFNLDKLSEYCMALPDLPQSRCYANVASRLIETDWDNIDKAVAWCEQAKEADKDSVCYEELVRQASFTLHPETKEFLHLCNDLPTPYNNKCLKGNR